MSSTKLRQGAFIRVPAGVIAAVALLAVPTAAGGQEAPICTTWKQKLSDGRDVKRFSGGRQSVIGLRGRDRLNGAGGRDLVNGGRDNDVVKGGKGNDVLCGGRGTDVIHGGPGDDLIYGEEENDTIDPGSGNDRVLGSAGDDRVYGWALADGQYVDDGIDILDGGFNDDLVEAGGADSIYGGTHADVLRTQTPLVAPAFMDGGGNDDTIYGSDAADDLRGGENGRDILFGAGGDDRMLGQGNDDELYGQHGNDSLDGGDGFDLLNGGDGFDICDGGELDDRAQECERTSGVPRTIARSRRDGGEKSRIVLAKLTARVAKGEVRSEQRSCLRGRKVSLFVLEDFRSDKIAITYTDRGGDWRVRRDLEPGRYFAKVESSKGCRFDNSRLRTLAG